MFESSTSESSGDSSSDNELEGVEIKMEAHRRRRRRRLAADEEEEAERSSGIKSLIFTTICLILFYLYGDATPVDSTLRMTRDDFTGETNLEYLSTRYNFESHFRMDSDSLIELADELLPGFVHRTLSRDVYTNTEGLAIVIRRLVFPSRWSDLTAVFGRPPAQLCRIFHEVLAELDLTWGFLLDFNPTHFNGQLQNWAQAIAARGAPAPLNIIAFIDGTLRRTTRPAPSAAGLPAGVTPYAIQRAQYSGHKRHHGFKFQDIIAPNGLIIGSYGPVDGRHSDPFMLARSGVIAALPNMQDSTGTIYRLFGDSIYPFLPRLFRMYRNTVPGSPQYLLNKIMSKVRVSVEWGFNLVTNSFQAVDFIRWQRMYLTKPARQYRIATLLTNCLSIMRGTNQISEDFNCPLPTLRDYLNGDW